MGKDSKALVRAKPLAIDDPGSRRWYISDEIRNLWVTSGAAVSAITALVAGSGSALITTAAFAAPVALVGFVRGLYYRRHKLPPHVPFPRVGEPGPPEVTEVLQRIYDEVNPPHEARFRLTLFVPDPREPMLLRQFARYSTHATGVSEATVRMGTGDVGLAFTRCETVHIPNIDELGSFEEAMRRLGVEEVEADAHQQRDRKSFYSIPIVDPEKHIRYGVLSLDAKQPSFFIDHRGRVRGGAVRANLMALMDQIRVAKFPGSTKPESAAVRDEITEKSEDSAPQERPRQSA